MSSPVDPAKTFGQDLPAEFAPIRREVQLVTSLGIFLSVQSRQVFVGAYWMKKPDRKLSSAKMRLFRCRDPTRNKRGSPRSIRTRVGAPSSGRRRSAFSWTRTTVDKPRSFVATSLRQSVQEPNSRLSTNGNFAPLSCRRYLSATYIHHPGRLAFGSLCRRVCAHRMALEGFLDRPRTQ
jgi:hypothetical protein